MSVLKKNAGVADGCKGRRRGGGGGGRAVKWSGKNEFWSGKSQGILFQTKSGHPNYYNASVTPIHTIASHVFKNL